MPLRVSVRPQNHDGLRAPRIKVSSLCVFLQNMQMFVFAAVPQYSCDIFAAIFAAAADSANPAAGGCIRCDFVAHLRAEAGPACCRSFAGMKRVTWLNYSTSQTFPSGRQGLCLWEATAVEIPSSLSDI